MNRIDSILFCGSGNSVNCSGAVSKIASQQSWNVPSWTLWSPMSTEKLLPQSGWILDSALADCLTVSKETLRDWIKLYKLPARQVGNTILIHLETFYASLPPIQHGDAPEKPLNPKGKKP